MDYRLTLSYRGTAYAGWQRQDNAATVQQTVEEALGDLLGHAVTIHGAGRTDAGVHARGQTAHLRLAEPFPEKGLVHGTNHRLPPDIRLLAAYRMGEGFHARKSALGKEYLYRLYRGRVVPPLAASFMATAPRELDLGAMRRALAELPGRHDFTAFASAGGSHTQPWRRIFAATADEHGRELRLRFAGDGFLRGMVRALVGTLVEIGRGRRNAGWMAELLEGRPRTEAGPGAKARGLTLERVFYPPEWRPLGGYEA
ncbi:MAG: tRNA pseudouridine(38-40) synthase TruA [bacterium]|nr:tRNA pseudouridine(38-40) synthase TruA [bacterium]